MCLGRVIWDHVGRGETKWWWPETGLNRRRRPFQGRALPLSYLASVQTSVACLRVESGETGKGGRVHVKFAATTGSVYQLPFRTPNLRLKPAHKPSRCSTLEGNHAPPSPAARLHRPTCCSLLQGAEFPHF